MRENGWFENPETSADDILSTCARLSGTVPELRALRTSNRRPLKPDNLAEVVQALLAGGDIVAAYRTEELSSSSAMRKKAEELIAGAAPTNSSTHERIEAFIDDLKHKIVHELPQLIGAMLLLLRYRDADADLSVFEQVLTDLSKARKRIE
jgi:hypothetical protein